MWVMFKFRQSLYLVLSKMKNPLPVEKQFEVVYMQDPLQL